MPRSHAPAVVDNGPKARSDHLFGLRHELSRLLDEVLRESGDNDSDGTSTMVPPIDMHESADRFRICAELPGLTLDDIDLRLEGDLLTIRGEKRLEHTDERTHVTERFFGTLQRTIKLPFRPNANEVRATLENGLLWIVLAKEQHGEKSRRIPVEGAQTGDYRSPAGETAAPVDDSFGEVNPPLQATDSRAFEGTTLGAEPIDAASSATGNTSDLASGESVIERTAAKRPRAQGHSSEAETTTSAPLVLDSSLEEPGTPGGQLRSETVPGEVDASSAEASEPAPDERPRSGFYGWIAGSSRKNAERKA
jgi:HSP20 family protein